MFHSNAVFDHKTCQSITINEHDGSAHVSCEFSRLAGKCRTCDEHSLFRLFGRKRAEERLNIWSAD
jgi:hypothetical protein